MSVNKVFNGNLSNLIPLNVSSWNNIQSGIQWTKIITSQCKVTNNDVTASTYVNYNLYKCGNQMMIIFDNYLNFTTTGISQNTPYLLNGLDLSNYAPSKKLFICYVGSGVEGNSGSQWYPVHVTISPQGVVSVQPAFYLDVAANNCAFYLGTITYLLL